MTRHAPAGSPVLTDRRRVAAWTCFAAGLALADLAPAAAPSLAVGACAAPATAEAERRCVPVNLVSNGNAVASFGFTATYDTSGLRMPGGAADVEAGPALTGGHTISAAVSEDLPSMRGRVRVLVIPPFLVPAPSLTDGELVHLCFTPPAGAVAGCQPVQLPYATGLEADFGDPNGNDLPVDPQLLVDGGVLVAGPVAEVTVNVPSDTFTLKDKTTPPTPKKRGIAFKADTKTAAPANKVVVPARNSPGDPTVGGATLTVYNAAGSGETVVVALPASGWTATDDAPTPRGYRFSGTDAITQVVIKPDEIKVKGGKASWAYTLDEASQGRMALRLQLGSDPPWCAEVGARTSGNPPSSAKYDHVDRFTGSPKSPAPDVCPAMP